MPQKKTSKRLKVLNKMSVLQLEAKKEISKKNVCNSEMTAKVFEEPDVYVKLRDSKVKCSQLIFCCIPTV